MIFRVGRIISTKAYCRKRYTGRETIVTRILRLEQTAPTTHKMSYYIQTPNRDSEQLHSNEHGCRPL